MEGQGLPWVIVGNHGFGGGLGAWWRGQGFRWGWGGWSSGTLTAADQGLVHEPDVGEALLTRLRDAHLVAGEHVPIVLLDLGTEEGAEQHVRAGGCSFTAGFFRTGWENTR